jgi:hypothetical protein
MNASEKKTFEWRGQRILGIEIVKEQEVDYKKFITHFKNFII